MDTVATIVSISPAGMNTSYGKNNKNIKYTKKNPPKNAKISCSLRV